MNSFNSNKLLAFLLLLVMVLNPLVATAGSFVFERGNSGLIGAQQPTLLVSSSHMDMAKCHESSDDRSIETHAEQSPTTHSNTDSLNCCDDLCMCAQGGCHASLTMHFDTNFSFGSNITTASYNGSGYLNPVLSSLTPPPIA